MGYFEKLYGSQYHELSKKGKDGTAGRLNGNLFLMAFFVLLFFLVIAVLLTAFPEMERHLNSGLRNWFGNSSGKTIGRLLAVPLMLVGYALLRLTVGSKKQYELYVQAFMQRPEAEREKATLQILRPFFIVLVLWFVWAMSSLFR